MKGLASQAGLSGIVTIKLCRFGCWALTLLVGSTLEANADSLALYGPGRTAAFFDSADATPSTALQAWQLPTPLTGPMVSL